MTKVKLDIVEVPEHKYSWHDYSFDDQEKAVKLLHNWQYNNTNCFTDVLFNLFMKADKDNINKLRKGFNLYYQVLQEWHKSGNNGNDLFEEFGLKVSSFNVDSFFNSFNNDVNKSNDNKA